MFFTDSSESQSPAQTARIETDPLRVQFSPLPTGDVPGTPSATGASGQSAPPVLPLDADFAGNGNPLSATTATVEFAPNPVISSLETQNVDPSFGSGTDLTGTDFAAAQLEADQITAPSGITANGITEGTLRINSGGGAYTDDAGQTWLADQNYVNGPNADTSSNTETTNNTIDQTQNGALYQSNRYAKNLKYNIPVANGIYDVNLHFAETFWKGTNKRRFDIAIEGKTLSQNLDISAEKGQNKALTKDFSNIEVTDGVLDLSMLGTEDKAILSGIEVFSKNRTTEGAQPPVAENNATENNATETSQNQASEPPDSTPKAPPTTNANNPDSSSTAPTGKGTTRYITPNGSGDGSSWGQAAQLSALNDLVENAAPGDEILIAGDQGNYSVVNQPIGIRHGGSDKAPIFIRGAASQNGGNDTPLFVSDRAESWQPGKADGGEVFRLLNGSGHLNFSNLGFKNVGNGAFRLGGNLTGITLENMTANNVRRFVENTASGSAKGATVNDLTIRDIDIRGFSKSAIRLQYNTNDVLIEDVFGDSQGHVGDSFAMGINLAGSVNNVTHRRVTMKNATQRGNSSDYWNADGFVTEEDTYNITYEDTFAAGNTDGGYDLKSDDTTLIRAKAADNKRNFRIWGSATMYDVNSDDPVRRGGTGTDAHIHVLGEGDLKIEGGTFTGNKSIKNIVFDVDDKTNVVVNDAVIKDNLYTLQTVQNGNLKLNNVVEQ